MKRNYITLTYSAKFGSKEVMDFYSYSYNPEHITLRKAYKNAHKALQGYGDRKSFHSISITSVSLTQYDCMTPSVRILLSESVTSALANAELQRVWLKFRQSPSLMNLEVCLAELEDFGICEGMRHFEKFLDMALGIINEQA